MKLNGIIFNSQIRYNNSPNYLQQKCTQGALSACQTQNKYSTNVFNKEFIKQYLNFGNSISAVEQLLVQEYEQVFPEKLKPVLIKLKNKDLDTYSHSLRVALYAVILARELDKSEEEIKRIEIAALLHDVGKIDIDDAILKKPGRLTNVEYDKMKQHSNNSQSYLSPLSLDREILYGAKYHHERWSGTGYPEHLKGGDIPEIARIISLADTYDTITSSRSYKKAKTHIEAINEIQRCANEQFDPTLSKQFSNIGSAIFAAKIAPISSFRQHSMLYKEGMKI